MLKRFILMGLWLPLFVFSSCWSENSSPMAVDLATFHASDSTYSFQAPERFERIVDEPERIVLQYENKSNPDFNNMLIILRKLACSDSSYLDFVEQEVAARNAKGAFQLELVERNDSIHHYQFRIGPSDIDDWYMQKKGERYCYSIYYAGEKISMEEASRLLNSIVERDHVPAPSLQTRAGVCLYPELGIEVADKYELVKSLKMYPFVLDKDLANKPFFELYTHLADQEGSSCLLAICAFELRGDIQAYFEDFVAQQKEKRACHIYSFQGNHALEFSCYEPNRAEFEYGKTLCFLHKNRFYQLSVLSAQEQLSSACYHDFIGSLKLV